MWTLQAETQGLSTERLMEPPLPPLPTRGFPGKSGQRRRREGPAPPAVWVLAGPAHPGQLGVCGSVLQPRLRTEF